MPAKINKFWKINAQGDELELLLYGVVGEDDGWNELTSKQFAQDLNEHKNVTTITLRVNSPGGNVFAGQAIYSMLKRHSAKKIGYVDGLAASIASLVVMACDTVIMPKNAMMMIHKPWNISVGNADDMRETAKMLDKVGESMAAAYKEKSGLDDKEILDIMTEETWMTAAEAVEKGFADVIEESEIAACIKGDKVLAINGQDVDISKFGNFDLNWFPKAQEAQKPPKLEAKAQINPQPKLTDIKAKEKTMLKKLCAQLGVNYDAMITDGRSEDEIYAACLTKMNDKHREASASEQQRMKEILALGKNYDQNELALDYIQNGRTVAEFKDALLAAHKAHSNEPTKSKIIKPIGLTDQEVSAFSFMNLIRAMANPTDKTAREAAAHEFEVCAAAEQAYGSKNNGQVIPLDVLKAPLVNAAAGDTVDTTTGANLISTDLRMASFIELLRNKAVIMGLATELTGLVGSVDIPKQTAGMSGYWVGEDTEPTETEPAFGKLDLDMKTVGGTVYLTRKMKKQTTLDMEAFLRNDIATAIALQIDLKAFYGLGSSNQPTGIKFSDGINTKEFAAANPTYTELVGMESEVAADNADVGSMAYILNAKMRGHCKTTEKFTGSNGAAIWEPGNMVNGYKALVTNQISDGDVFFGNFADLIIGMWGGLEITVDPYTNSKKGGTQITGFQDVDMGVRHGASFCFGSTDLTGTTGTTG